MRSKAGLTYCRRNWASVISMPSAACSTAGREQLVAQARADIVIDIEDDAVPGDVAVAEHVRAGDEADPAAPHCAVRFTSTSIGTRTGWRIAASDAPRLRRETFQQEAGVAASPLQGNRARDRALADEGKGLGPVGADKAIGLHPAGWRQWPAAPVAIERLAQAIAGILFCRRLSRLLWLERPHPASRARCAGVLNVGSRLQCSP
jgi:hypothetical protein